MVCSFCFCDGSIRFLSITFKTWTYQKRKIIYEIHLFKLDLMFLVFVINYQGKYIDHYFAPLIS